MKHKLLIVFPLVIILAIAHTTFNASTNAAGAPASKTGAPGEQACGPCHGGTAINSPGLISTTIPASGYIPGQTYSVNAQVSQQGVSKFGFQLTVQDVSGNPIGTLISTNATQLKGSGAYITHTGSSNLGVDSKTWTFDWIAPSLGSGDINFYAAFNASNNNNNASGDQIYTSSYFIFEDQSVSIPEISLNKSWSIYPNPASNIISIKGKDLQHYSLYNIDGKIVKKFYNLNSKSIDLSEFKSGIYFLKNENDEVLRFLIK